MEERSLNAPKNRLAATLSFQNLAKGKMFINLSGRWVQEYNLYSGSQIGTKAGEGKRGIIDRGINPATGTPRTPLIKNFDHGALGGFTTFDISAGYRFTEFYSVGVGMSNIFDTEQKEFVGSPSIGRLYSIELKATLPSFLKK